MKKILALIIALVLAMSLAGCGEKYSLWYVPGQQVVQSQEQVLMLKEGFSYEVPNGSLMTLTGAVWANGRLNLEFQREMLPEEEGNGSGGTYGYGGSYILKLNDKEYPSVEDVSFTNYQTMISGDTTYFDIPGETLEPGKEYTLTVTVRGEERDGTFTLEPAIGIKTMGDIPGSVVAESNGVTVAAVPENTQEGIKITLYSINQYGMERVSYGMDQHYGRPSLIPLTKGDETLYARQKYVSGLYYSNWLTAETDSYEGWQLAIESMALKDQVDISVQRQFASREEALSYHETIDLGKSQLELTVEEGDDGSLILMGLPVTTNEGWRLCAVNTDGTDDRFQREGGASRVSADITDTALNVTFSSVKYQLELNMTFDFE